MPTLTRVYQGRVTKVEVACDKNAAGEQQWCLLGFTPERVAKLETEQQRLRGRANESSPEGNTARKRLAEINRQLNEPWQTTLWKHHELFQDAVNYYFAVFAAMVPNSCGHRYWNGYRDVIENSTWQNYTGRNGTWPTPFAAACRVVRLADDAPFSQFQKAVFQLTGSSATENQRFTALLDLFRAVDKITQAEGATEEALAGEPKNLFGQEFVSLCAQKTGVKDKVTKGKQKGRAAILVAKVQGGACLTWDDVFAFKTHPGRKPWSRTQAEAKIAGWFKDLLGSLETAHEILTRADLSVRTEKGRSQLADQKEKITSLLRELSSAQPDFNTWLTAKETMLPTDEPERAGRGGESLKSAVLFALRRDVAAFRDAFLYFNRNTSAPDDAPSSDRCYEARHAGGVERPVFPLFLDLWCGRENDKSVGQGVWPDFEKAAFAEAYIKIGQFQRMCRDFEKRLNDANKTIARVEQELATDPESKLHIIQEITEDLAEGIVGEDGQERRYTIRDRTLKAWSKVRSRWREVLKEKPATTTDELVAEKNTLQRKLREKFGSAPLFEMLAKHPLLWNSGDESTDPLDRWAEFEEALEEKEHLEEGLNFTPAHARHSPRYFRWSDTNSRTHLPWAGMTGDNPDRPKPFVVRVDAFDFERKTTSEMLLHFHAPRLLRNGLRQMGEQMNEKSPDLVSLPPALRAIVEHLHLPVDKQTFAGTSVRLAPSPDTEENVQLVFEHSLECKQLPVEWRRNFPFTGFSSKQDRDSLMGLKWPFDDSKPADWQKTGKIQCLAVDLGINNAAAFQVMRAESAPAGTSTKGLIHEITPTDAPERWYVRSVANGMIRLSGEDAWVYREIREKDHRNTSRKLLKAIESLASGQTKTFLPELSGSAGRKAVFNETRDAEGWFTELSQYGDNFHQRHRHGAAGLSYPQQNDELIFGLSRLRSQLFRLHRWAEHIYAETPKIADATKQQKLQERAEKRRSEALKQVAELDKDDPLKLLKPLASDRAALRTELQRLIDDYLVKFVELLPKFADRILPSRRGRWVWRPAKDGWHQMLLDETQTRPDAWLAGQRGLSYARLRQLKELRQLAQSLNHLCRHKFAKRYQAGRREDIPEPFEACRQALEDARNDRVKQIAHAIFAAALGVELDVPPPDKKEQKRTKSLHGVYRCLERDPVNFIALERLADYKTTDRQSRRENRQLAEWRHREIHRVLEELCLLVGMPIVHVDPTNTSRLSGKDHSIGFRAEEVFPDDPRIANWQRIAKQEDERDLQDFLKLLEQVPAGTCKSLLRPREGGPVFVSLHGDLSSRPDSVLSQADLNGAYRIGLRALAHPNRWDALGFFSSKRAIRKQDETASATEDSSTKEKNHGVFLIDRFSIFEKSARRDGCDYPVIRAGERHWDLVRGDLAVERCRAINVARLKKWGVVLPEEDNIPM